MHPLFRPKALLLASALALTSACAGEITTHGNLPLEEVIEQIKPGETNQNQVADMLGSPSTIATFERDIWYYIGNRKKKLAFFEPTLLERKILEIKFDRSGVVESIERFDAEDGKDLDLVSRTTPTKGKELTFMQQLIGNLGKFTIPDDE